MRIRYLVLFLAIAPGTARAQTIRELPQLKAVFDGEGFDGSILILDARSGEYSAYNSSRARQAFLPASTFKIVNAMIALETGVAPDDGLMIPWDGVKRSIETRNRNHTLSSAFRVSAVPYYQEVARRIGRERMQRYIDRLNYGNRDISGPIDQFWLNGTLRVTSLDQISVLRGIHDLSLALSRRTMEVTQVIMLSEDTGKYRIYGKTGLGSTGDRYTGWWVGWVERNGRVWYFATNLDGPTTDDRIIPARMAVTKKALQALRILP